MAPSNDIPMKIRTIPRAKAGTVISRDKSPRLTQEEARHPLLDRSSPIEGVGRGNTKLSGEPADQISSYFDQDSSDDEAAQKTGRFEEISAFWQRRKRLIVALGISILILLAAILGAILGSRASKAISEPDSDHKKPTDSGYPNTDATAIVPQNASALAITRYHGTKTSAVSRLLFFVSTTGDLAVHEVRPNGNATYLVKDKIPDLPPALVGSPLKAVSFGVEQVTHVFYLDPSRYIRHLTRFQHLSESASWQLDLDFSRNGKQSHLSGNTLAVAVLQPSVVTSNGSLLVLAFGPNDKQSEVQLMWTVEQGTNTQWMTSRVVLIAPNPGDERLPKIEPAFELVSPPLVLPKVSQQYIARIIGVLSENTVADAIFDLNCRFRDAVSAPSCPRQSDVWKSTKDREMFLGTIKPLRLGKVDLSAHPPAALGDFLLAFLDHSGRYLELLWDGGRITAIKSFPSLRVTVSDRNCNLSDFVSTMNGALFVTSCRTVVEMERQCAWWLDSCEESRTWKFVSVLNLTAAER